MTQKTIPFIAPEACPKVLIQLRFENFHRDNPEVKRSRSLLLAR
jgi:hypothetical protein